MNIEVSTDVDYDVDEIIDIMSKKEKREMFNALAAEFDDTPPYDEEFNVAKYLGGKSPFELKKIICNALNVPSYQDEQALRKALEKIINA